MAESPLLLKNIIHNNHTCDILIENGIFRQIADSIIAPPDCKIIDGKGNLAISPAFYNIQ